MSTDPVAANLQSVHDADKAHEFTWHDPPLHEGIGLALSGGGYRALLFHAGALARLNEWGALPKLDRISAVSGGAIAAGLLALKWASLGSPDAQGVFQNFGQVFVEPALAFSKHTLDIRAGLIGLLPRTSVAEEVAKSYDKLLFSGATLQALPERPDFVFCATNFQTGVLWRFTKRYAGDYIVGCIPAPQFRIAEAVAASAAFPPFLSPMRLGTSPGDFHDWPGASGVSPRAVDPAPFRQNIVLSDGGVYDNHGLEPIVKSFTTILVSDGGKPFARTPRVAANWASQLLRVNKLMDNQVRALRRRDLIARFSTLGVTTMPPPLDGTLGNASRRVGTYWGVDTHPKPDVPGMIACSAGAIKRLAGVATRLADPGDQIAKQLINWGYAVCDYCVRAHYPTLAGNSPPPPRLPYPEAPLH
jgi:NTE family protein